uniref:Uncharacterized protein n=1 Tax=Nelumbo nucifera TaxID=4432 RepID=A0A822YVR3_NELNU|nr:TPA_asm: hypothetical protein HUJ06_005476 [Nelumbo nucifera]
MDPGDLHLRISSLNRLLEQLKSSSLFSGTAKRKGMLDLNKWGSVV